MDNLDIPMKKDGSTRLCTAPFCSKRSNILDNVFPNHWLSRQSAIEWPPKSLDVTPLEFLLWGYMENRVYKNRPENIEDVNDRIMMDINNMRAGRRYSKCHRYFSPQTWLILTRRWESLSPFEPLREIRYLQIIYRIQISNFN